MYDKNKYTKIKEDRFQFTAKDKSYRPCLLTLFEDNKTNNKIVVANCHFPHTITSVEDNEKIDDVMNELFTSLATFDSDITNHNIIIMGDFNTNIPSLNKYLNTTMSKIKFNDPYMKLKTCCFMKQYPFKKETSKSRADNIFTTIGTCEYDTMDEKPYDPSNYPSDHKPLHAMIQIENYK